MLACAAMSALVWFVAFRTGHGRSLDLRVLDRVSRLDDGRLEMPLEAAAALINPVPYGLLAAAVMAVGYVGRGRIGAIVVAVVLVAPNAITQWLKTATAEDRIGTRNIVHVEAASWPSGHATAAMALALAALLVAPARLRAFVAAAGLVFAGVIGLCVVALGWHFPSDVAGGYLIAAAGACAGVSLLETRAAPRGRWLPARG
jgi:membrane-associated phospholipid phosphatase